MTGARTTQRIRCSKCGEAMTVVDFLPHGAVYDCPGGDGHAFISYVRLKKEKPETLTPDIR